MEHGVATSPFSPSIRGEGAGRRMRGENGLYFRYRRTASSAGAMASGVPAVTQ